MCCALLVVLALLPVLAWAQSGNGSTRADPVMAWEFLANPAAQAFMGDLISLGIRTGSDLNQPEAALDTALDTLELSAAFGGSRYDYLLDGSVRIHAFTTAFGTRRMATGLRLSWPDQTTTGGAAIRYDVGVLVRPWDILSLGLTLGQLATDTPIWGLGIGLRPLASLPGLGSLLTLTADATLHETALTLDTVGVRIALGEAIGLRAWLNPASLSVGIQAGISLGSLESALSLKDVREPAKLSMAAALRVPFPGREAVRPFGKTMLVMSDIDALMASPSFSYRIGADSLPWLGTVIAAIDRAAHDPRIDGLVIINPPMLDSEASGQALYRSLAAFRQAGKQLFVHARTLDRLSYVFMAAQADLLALDPNGQLVLTDVGSFSLYLRGLLDRLGIRLYSLQSHDTKTAYHSFTEYGMTDAERAMKERYVRGLAAAAYQALEAGRADRLVAGAAELLSSGPYLVPSAALDAGLLDAVMYRDEFDELVEVWTGKTAVLDILAYAAAPERAWGPAIGSKTIAVVHLAGTIIIGEGQAGLSIGDSTARLIAQLREDRSVAGIILRVDSGGGAALTSDLIAREVSLTVAAGKPVYASMGAVAASGGYYIAAPASRIYAEAATITGSIGVTGIYPDGTGLLEKLDIGAASVAASVSADFGNPLLPHRAADMAALLAAIRHTYERFVDVVARGRSMDPEQVDELARGQVWLGSEAFGLGLVDEIGGLDAAKTGLSAVLGGRTRFIEYLPGEGPAWLSAMLGDMLVNMLVDMDRPSAILGKALDTAMGGTAMQLVSVLAALDSMGDGPLALLPEYLFRASSVRR
jgi:protease-4